MRTATFYFVMFMMLVGYAVISWLVLEVVYSGAGGY